MKWFIVHMGQLHELDSQTKAKDEGHTVFLNSVGGISKVKKRVLIRSIAIWLELGLMKRA